MQQVIAAAAVAGGVLLALAGLTVLESTPIVFLGAGVALGAAVYLLRTLPE